MRGSIVERAQPEPAAAGPGMLGRAHPALAGSGPTGLVDALPEGGAEAIASRGRIPGDDELLDRAAMESGTD